MIAEIILKAIEGLEEELEKAYRRLAHHYPHHPRCRHRHQVKQVFLTIFNNNKFIVMSPQQILLSKGFHVVAALLDAVTNAPIDGATKVLKSRTVTDTTIAVIDANGDLKPLKVGAASLTEVNTWEYPDRDNPGQNLSQDETTNLDFQVILGPEGILQTVTLVQFDPPAAAPAATA